MTFNSNKMVLYVNNGYDTNQHNMNICKCKNYIDETYGKELIYANTVKSIILFFKHDKNEIKYLEIITSLKNKKYTRSIKDKFIYIIYQIKKISSTKKCYQYIKLDGLHKLSLTLVFDEHHKICNDVLMCLGYTLLIEGDD